MKGITSSGPIVKTDEAAIIPIYCMTAMIINCGGHTGNSRQLHSQL